MKTGGANLFRSESRKYDYDYLCIGTSCLMSLEALYLSKTGKAVLMVDAEQTFGGAWKTIEIAGIRDVENAVHYFLPNKKAIEFMKTKLNWPIKISKKKYKYLKISNTRYLRFHYDSLLGRLVYKILSAWMRPGFKILDRNFWISIIQILVKKHQPSCYVSYGAAGMLKSIASMLSEKNVDVWYQSQITSIYFDMINETVKCVVNDKIITANKLILGHGARLPIMNSNEQKLELAEKIYPRPAFHLVLDDSKIDDALEIVLTSDPLVKYVHNVTRFTSLGKEQQKVQKVFVFALQSEVSNSLGLAEDLLQKLVDIKLVHAGAKIIASRYEEVFLPTLSDQDLDAIKGTFGKLVDVLKTENFTAGIEYCAERWQD